MGQLHRARWGKALTGFLDDELKPSALDRILHHLEQCPDCLHELEQMVRMQHSLGRMSPMR